MRLRNVIIIENISAVSADMKPYICNIPTQSTNRQPPTPIMSFIFNFFTLSPLQRILII